MIIPSIDLMNGRAVQLVGGKKTPESLDLGDPISLAKRLSIAGELAVIDLDAAMGNGSNEGVVRKLINLTPCRVGGGIRSVEKAISYLDVGATKVILGTMATPELLFRLPRDRVIAALDEKDGKVTVEGWQKDTDSTVADKLDTLRPYVSGFLVTAVDVEGQESGMDIRLMRLLNKYNGMDLTLAGGVKSAEEVAWADQCSINIQLGMALHTGKLSLTDAILAPMIPSDRPDGLWPTVVTDESGIALGLVYSDRESVREALRTGQGVYHSRKRGLWRKGVSSGNTQKLLRITPDCDRDTLRFVVQQKGTGFCHQETNTCWGPYSGLPALEQTLIRRTQRAPDDSYTERLLKDPDLLGSKLVEEARELAEAYERSHVAREAADLLYFALVALVRSGSSLSDVGKVLDLRAQRITRRPGDAKPKRLPQSDGDEQ